MKKKEYTVEEAQKVFEKLIDRVIKGEEIVLVDGKCRAKLVPIEKRSNRRKSQRLRSSGFWPSRS